METLVIKQNKAKPFSHKDDEAILTAIKRNPGNFSAAFKIVAEQLDRTPDSIAGRWYGRLRIKVKASSPAVVDKSQRVQVVNVQEAESLRMEVLKDMLSKLTPEEKRRVVSYILEI